MEFRTLTSEEKGILKERLNLLLKVNLAIIIIAIVYFFSVFLTMRSFGIKLWILLAVLPTGILLGSTLFLYLAGNKIRKDYKNNQMAIISSKLEKIFFQKKHKKFKYFVIFDENKFEIDEKSFEKLNGMENKKFNVYFTKNSNLVFKIERCS